MNTSLSTQFRIKQNMKRIKSAIMSNRNLFWEFSPVTTEALHRAATGLAPEWKWISHAFRLTAGLECMSHTHSCTEIQTQKFHEIYSDAITGTLNGTINNVCGVLKRGRHTEGKNPVPKAAKQLWGRTRVPKGFCPRGCCTWLVLLLYANTKVCA